MAEYDVIINGGGPVGTGLAIELGQRGIRVALVERHKDPQRIPKGQNLTQRTVEHFRAWNCAAELLSAHPIPEGSGIGGMTSYGTLLSGYHYDWLNRSHVREFYDAPNARLPQYATEQVLRDRAADIQSIVSFHGWSGEALDLDTDSVSLTIAHRDSGARKTLDAAYIVGCDGSRSFIRAAAGISETLSEHNRMMALVVFRSEELHELLKRYPGKAFYNVLHPEFEGYWQFFGRVDHGTSWFFHAPIPEGSTKESVDFTAMLYRAVGQPFDLDLDYIGFWDLRVSIADTYSQGRAFIAGDAAHSHPPYGGYGINTGFEDARNLGWKMAAALQGWGGHNLLDSYTAERRPVFVSTAKDFIERFIEDDKAFLQRYSPERDRAEFLEAWTTRNLDANEVLSFEPNYEGSRIVAPVPGACPSASGSHEHRARAGHHLSPQKLTDGTSVFDALGSGFSLLTENTSIAHEYAEAARILGLPLTMVSGLSPEARTSYAAEAVLVRPDHYVAWAGANGAVAHDVLACASGMAD